MPRSALAALCVALVPAGCSQPAMKAPYPAVDVEQIRTHLTRLNEAMAAGTEPGSRGEQLAVQYVTSVFNGIGGMILHPQRVQLTRITPTSASLTVAGRALRAGDDFVAWTRRHVPVATANGDMVFVGYGISTPKQGWDDYKGVDVKGKILLILIGGPHSGKRDLLGAAGEDYYGRRRYKFEEAQRRGAAGVFLIHLTDQNEEHPEPSWEAIKGASTEILGVGTPEAPTAHLAVEGWMTKEAARDILKEAGHDFDELKGQTAQTNFKPVVVPLRASAEVRNDLGVVTSTNVVAELKGTEPGYVLYSTQWNDLPSGGPTGHDLTDEDARNQPPPGLPVVLEVARALSREPAKRRTFVFLIVTAASEGLLGLEYYLEHPVYALTGTMAAIHLAGFNVESGGSHISIIGSAFPGLKELVREQAAEQFRVASADVDLERLHFFRSGEESYTDKEVPSIFLASRRPPESGPGAGAAAQPDLSVAVLDAQLLFHVGRRVATARNWPDWKPTRTILPPGAPEVKLPGGGR